MKENTYCAYAAIKVRNRESMNKNGIIEIADGIYQIKYYWLGVANVYMFLIVGEEKAMLIDTGYSVTGALQYAREVTSQSHFRGNLSDRFIGVFNKGSGFGEAVFHEVFVRGCLEA